SVSGNTLIKQAPDSFNLVTGGVSNTSKQTTTCIRYNASSSGNQASICGIQPCCTHDHTRCPSWHISDPGVNFRCCWGSFTACDNFPYTALFRSSVSGNTLSKQAPDSFNLVTGGVSNTTA